MWDKALQQKRTHKMVRLVTEQAPNLICIKCGAWTETGVGTLLLNKCEGRFTADRKKAFDRAFVKGVTPNKHRSYKVLQVHLLEKDDPDLVDIRQGFQDNRRKRERE